MTTFAFWIWLGGIQVAYRRNRQYGENKIWSFFNALFWPSGLGFALARDFYREPDWGEK